MAEPKPRVRAMSEIGPTHYGPRGVTYPVDQRLPGDFMGESAVSALEPGAEPRAGAAPQTPASSPAKRTRPPKAPAASKRT